VVFRAAPRIASSAACALLAISLMTACSAPTSDSMTSPAQTDRPTQAPSPSSTDSSAERPTLGPEVVGPTEEPTTPYPSASPAPAPEVDVLLTYADWISDTAAVEVGAFASTLDQSGTCTLDLSRDEDVVTVTAEAQPSASTMSCGLSVPGASLTSGTWVAQVTYSSGDSTGTSSSVEVTVP